MKPLLFLCAAALLSGVAPAAEDGHDHAGHDHTGHDHGGHADEGPAHRLGEVAVAGTTFTVTLHGEVEAGSEAVLGIEVANGPKPSELRAWVGVQNGRGSVKALLPAEEPGHYHGHLEVPATLPDGSAVWIEVVTDAGRERGSLPLPAADHAHDDKKAEDHAGHDHGPAEKDHPDHAGHDHAPAEAEKEHAGHDHGDHAGHDH